MSELRCFTRDEVLDRDTRERRLENLLRALLAAVAAVAAAQGGTARQRAVARDILTAARDEAQRLLQTSDD